MTLDKTTMLASLQDTLISTIKRANQSHACLIVVHGPLQGKRFEISANSMRLGRDASADIVIDDPKVSRQQATLQTDAGVVSLIDGGSTNGTAINDTRLHRGDMAVLRRDDLIKVGSTVLKFLPQGELDARFIDALENRAHCDTLTQVYNKGYILEALDAEFRKAQVLCTPLSLLMVDLDHFKAINDQRGHDAGDQVLIEVSQVLRQAVAGTRAVLGRFGGEEFLVLLPGLDRPAARCLAEDIRHRVEHQAVIYDTHRIHLTASVGLASKTVESDSARELFKQADRALYQAKNAGRNQVC
ncbi:MAG: diguanylate cyclase [Comamonadaceae bacterium]|nr:diguanylate cyclase [Comamonadaceae bacterium]